MRNVKQMKRKMVEKQKRIREVVKATENITLTSINVFLSEIIPSMRRQRRAEKNYEECGNGKK